MNKSQKLRNFLQFSIDHKIPNLIKGMELQELSNLCCSILPRMSEYESLATRGQAIMLMSVIEQELKSRYPSIQDTNFNKPQEVAEILEKLGGLKK